MNKAHKYYSQVQLQMGITEGSGVTLWCLHASVWRMMLIHLS